MNSDNLKIIAWEITHHKPEGNTVFVTPYEHEYRLFLDQPAEFSIVPLVSIYEAGEQYSKLKQVPMTKGEIDDAYIKDGNDYITFARAIEAHHGIGGKP